MCIFQTEISELNVARMAEVMESLTANPNILTHADIVYTSQVLQSIAVVPRKKPKVTCINFTITQLFLVLLLLLLFLSSSL